MSLVTISIRESFVDETTNRGVKKGNEKCARVLASDGNPMFTGGEIKLKLVSIPFSVFVTVPRTVYIYVLSF